jgi:glycosyltransferase involved in cell wall biosynthesis
MGSQDGVDQLLKAARMIADSGRTNAKFLLVGSGPEIAALRRLCTELKLDAHVTFTGFLTGEELGAAMSAMDIGVCPDEYNEYNDKCTMNKIMEYMAAGIPVVQYDLAEGRVTAGDTALYARCNDEQDLAAQICKLVDNPELRNQLGRLGALRFQQHLQWGFEQPKLIKAYERLFAGSSR